MLFAGVAAAYLQVHAETRMGDMAGYSLTLTGDCEVMGVFRVCGTNSDAKGIRSARVNARR